MYIHPQDASNVTSYIHGFEAGSEREISEQIKYYIKKQYGIDSTAAGWPGQIKHLAEKKSHPWVRTFKQVMLQILAKDTSEEVLAELNQTITKRIKGLIKSLDTDPDRSYWQHDTWSEEWLSLCATDSKWFDALWTTEELNIIKAIDEQVKAGNVFDKNDPKTSSPELFRLFQQFKF